MRPVKLDSRQNVFGSKCVQLCWIQQNVLGSKLVKLCGLIENNRKKYSGFNGTSYVFCLFRFYVTPTQYKSYGDFPAKTSPAKLDTSKIYSGVNDTSYV
jgi:hypothetical protein